MAIAPLPAGIKNKIEFRHVALMLAYRRLGHSIMDKTLNNIEEYTKEDLMDSKKGKMIFRMYYFYEVHMTKSGWQFLIDYHGYEGLHEIDMNYGWVWVKQLKK